MSDNIVKAKNVVVTMEETFDDVKLTSDLNPITKELYDIFPKDISNTMDIYVHGTIVLCGVAFTHSGLPVRCIGVSTELSGGAKTYFSDDTMIWAAAVLTVQLNNTSSNYKYPYSTDIMKNRDKASCRWKGYLCDVLICSFPFVTPIKCETRVGMHFIPVTTGFTIDEYHNLAIGCSILLPFVQKYIWGVPEDLTNYTVFKFVKSPCKELEKNDTDWKKWKNSMFQHIVDRLELRSVPGFLLICPAGEVLTYSLQFVNHYLKNCYNKRDTYLKIDNAGEGFTED